MRIATIVLLLASPGLAETFEFAGLITEVNTRCRPDSCQELDDIDVPPVGTRITGLFTATPDTIPPFGSVDYRMPPWTGTDGLWQPESLPDGRLLYRGFGMASLVHDDGSTLGFADVALAIEPSFEEGEFILDIDLTGTGSEGFDIRADITLRPVPEPSTWLLAAVAVGVVVVWRCMCGQLPHGTGHRTASGTESADNVEDRHLEAAHQ